MRRQGQGVYKVHKTINIPYLISLTLACHMSLRYLHKDTHCEWLVDTMMFCDMMKKIL